MSKHLQFLLMAVMLAAICLTSCSPMDKNYGESERSELSVLEKSAEDNENGGDGGEDAVIMSSDRVMSKYFDISLFDEENYADIYLGKNFEISALYMGKELKVPVKLDELEDSGWTLAEGNDYNKNSLVFSYETIDATITNKDGVKLQVQFYNSTRSSVKLSECNLVKYRIKNEFYTNPNNYKRFDINGVNNGMAITDIINVLGTPSHFYRVSDKSYYLDYFISKDDRRNGITVYINPQDDSITSIEFSYYE